MSDMADSNNDNRDIGADVELVGHHQPDGWAEARLTIEEREGEHETLTLFRVRLSWEDTEGEGERFHTADDLKAAVEAAARAAGQAYIEWHSKEER